MFPLTDNIWITLAVTALVLMVPLVMNKIRFPQIAGLIIAGVIVGPGCLDIIEPNGELAFFSQIGLLFIMFFAGLEIDLEEMKKNKVWGMLFGILTFTIPWLLCFFSARSAVGLATASATVMACIMGSHTLVSYPIVSRYGQARRKSVTISVSGALVAILLALVIYAAALSQEGEGEWSPLFFAVKIALYTAFIILLYPRIARFFFRTVRHAFSHFLFVISMVLLSAGLARAAGLESILGAFMAGLALSRYIPKNSPLMNRLDFVGNSMFIPVFLLYTGMLIKVTDFVRDYNAMLLFAVLFAAGTLGKWIASLIVQKSCGMNRNDRKVLFGLSQAHAAGALAIAMGAFQVGLIDNSTLSTTILIVLTSCILSSIVTENGARGLRDSETPVTGSMADRRMLVALSWSSTLQNSMDMAIALAGKNNRGLVGLHVTVKGEHAQSYMQKGKQALDEARVIAESADVPFAYQNRLGTNIIESILHAADEFSATDILTGLPRQADLSLRYYENMIRTMVEGTKRQVVLQRLTIPLNTLRRLVVLVPGPVAQDNGFDLCMKTLYNLSMAIGCATDFYGKEQAVDAVRGTGLNFSSGRVTYHPMGENADMNWVMSNIHSDHMLVILGQRNTDSHAGRAFMHLFERIHGIETECSVMLMYAQTDNIVQELPDTGLARTGRDFLKMLRV